VSIVPGEIPVPRRDGGHGLGLAIISAVAGAHDAGLTVRARPEGGLDVTVMFRPCAGP
jgi:signal transduction histidine kinase